MLKCGIIGLPNVGKSTLFNALLKKQQAFVANYPFATIEPNVGVVTVPDSRLEVLASVVAYVSFGHLGGVHSVTPEESLRMPPIKPATVEFVDIAGLVKGASEGAGLGNKFLSHIREVSVIAHVVRAFEDSNIIKEGSIDPKSDYETIQTELILADIQTLEKSKGKSQNSKVPALPAGKQIKNQKEVIERLFNELNGGTPVRDIQLSDEEKEEMKQLFLLSAKPEIVVVNISEKEYIIEKMLHFQEVYSSLLVVPKERVVIICAEIESQIASFSPEEQKEYLAGMGLKESGLERLIKTAYKTLGLISFLTAPASADASARQGDKWEVRAWTIRNGATAVDAAGVIHTDFMKSFIKAEVVSYDDFVAVGGWKKARELGKARFEGRDYIMQDGDVVEFKIGQ